MSNIKLEGASKCFGGWVAKFSHDSSALQCRMRFSVVLPPPRLDRNSAWPLVTFLSGLTCNEDNFVQKAGAPAHAARLGLVIACPDTSPRGVDLPGDSDDWTFGKSAGYYVDATEQPWATNYRMYSYVCDEFPQVVAQALASAESPAPYKIDLARQSIMGHSMGGHGALVAALRNPTRYCSASAFAPICRLSHSAWGEKALLQFLGTDRKAWAAYDATALCEALTTRAPLLKVTQGTVDSFYVEGHLQPEAFQAAAAANSAHVSVNVTFAEGYDHSYNFVATFLGEHLDFHAQRLILD